MKRNDAIHEAGHAIVADALGLHVVSITSHRDGNGASTFSCTEQPRRCSEHFVLAAVALAGGCATARQGLVPYGCTADMKMARKQVRLYVRRMPRSHRDNEANTMRRACWLAQSIVNDRWTAIRALAAHLVKHGKASAKDVARFTAPWRSDALQRRRGRGLVPRT